MFNLTVDIYTFGATITPPPRLFAVPCQWRTIAKMMDASNIAAIVGVSVLTEILLPAGTDVRGIFEAPINTPDQFMLGPGTLNLPFQAVDVYDVGKGFTNEYRIALVRKLPPWPVPIP